MMAILLTIIALIVVAGFIGAAWIYKTYKVDMSQFYKDCMNVDFDEYNIHHYLERED